MPRSILYISLFVILIVFIFSKCSAKSTPIKKENPKEESKPNISSTEKKIPTKPHEITGSFHFDGSAYDLEKHIQKHFTPFFQKHNFSPNSKNSLYKNEFADLRIWVSDHRTISMTFRKKGEKDWLNFYLYLESLSITNHRAIQKKIYEDYPPTNLDELSEVMVMAHAKIAETFLNVPFEGDMSWEENYWKTKKLIEFINNVPRDSEMWKLYKAKDPKWKILAQEALDKSKN